MTRALLVLVLLGCSSQPSTQGLPEPVRMIEGQFVEGELPGLPPIPIDSGETPVSPRVTTVQNAGGILEFGDPKRTITGRTTGDAVSVAFGFEGLGTGYWIAPVRGRDAANPGEFTFEFDAEYSRSIPAGVHSVLFAAVDADELSGTQLDVRLCMTSEVPDNRNACDPRARPPGLVVSLGWDREVDLDLQVFTPDGVLVDAKHPSTAPDEDSVDEPGTGTLTFDSNAGCVIDGHRRESLVFEDSPPSGEYYVYANLFDACGEDSVRFTMTLHQPIDGANADEFDQDETHRTSGVLVASQANGGSNVGLFLTKFVVP